MIIIDVKKYKKYVTTHAILLFTGFSTILLIIMSAAYLSLNSMSVVNQRLENLVEDNNMKQLLMGRMADIIRERMLLVYTINHIEDSFEGEHIWEQLNYYASEFLQIRDHLYTLDLAPEEHNRLEAQRPLLIQSLHVIDNIIERLRADDLVQARILTATAHVNINRILEELERMRTLRQEIARESVREARQDYLHTRQQIIILNFIAFLSSIVIIIVVNYKITRQGDALAHAAYTLEEANNNLEQRVEARTRELLEARDQALEASRIKSRFLANMSHELRTPLNAIIGYTEMLQEEAEDLGHNYCSPDLDKILSAANHLLQLVNDVLDISKIEAGKMDICPINFDLYALVQEVNTTIMPLAEQHNNRILLNFDDRVHEMFADDMRIRQILYNLLSNACKFTHDGEITLTIQLHQQHECPWVSLQVRDTGIGISDEQKNKLFKSFSQVDESTTRKYGGTGLGLVISLRFCQLMGGNITVESQLGKGCLFTVWLPQYMPAPEIIAQRIDSDKEPGFNCLHRDDA
jgi:signal transduction histidine kinase